MVHHHCIEIKAVTSQGDSEFCVHLNFINLGNKKLKATDKIDIYKYIFVKQGKLISN